MSEAEVQAEILKALAGRTDLRAWRSNSGVARRGHQQVRFGVQGQADISGILADGRRLEIEVKSWDGRQTPEQRAFGAMITKFRGVYIIARSVEDVLEGLARCAA